MPRLYLTHNLVPGRTCGDCIACCVALKIDDPELSKPADQLCANCTGSGCAIYETRPRTCRDWHCLWRRMPLADDLRPDISGVMIALDRVAKPVSPFEHVYIVIRALTDEAALDQPQVREAIDLFSQEGTLPVWLAYGRSKRLVFPDSELVDAILNPETTPHTHLLARARAWADRYDRWAGMFSAQATEN